MIAIENESERKHRIGWIIHVISVRHAYVHSSPMKRSMTLCFSVCLRTSFFNFFYIKNYTNALTRPHNNWTKHIRIRSFVSPHKNVMKTSTNYEKGKRGKQNMPILYLRPSAFRGTFESSITHDWTRLKILRNAKKMKAIITLATTQILLAGDWAIGERRIY